MVQADFEAPWWLSSPHAQTVFSTVTRRRPALETREERLELADGDFVDLVWVGALQGPTVLVLHGLEGSIESSYARGILKAVVARGWRGVLMHFRGCSETPNRLPRAYHSGDTGDVAEVVATLRARDPDAVWMAVGYSLGGNVLLKWLGESGGDNPLRAAVAVSVPFVLEACADRLERGLSRVYMKRFLKELKASYAAKRPLGRLSQLRTIRQWDQEVTAPLHGFDSAIDYYHRSSSRQFLKSIEVETLVIHARDDPFMSPQVVPTQEELSASVRLEVSETGGHVGFIGGTPRRPHFWLESRIPEFLAQRLAEPS
jgi:hypothetical protein